MKGLKKIALCSAVALAPFAANADMKALNDSDMGSVTGQAGVTIDLSANVSVGEIAYKDQGFLAISGVSLSGTEDGIKGASETEALDDIRLTIDVAGDGAGDLGAVQATDYLTGALTDVNSTDVDVQDGDLVIALRSQTGLPVDFGLTIDKVSLAKSGGTIGQLGSSGGTVLVSDLKMNGVIGPVDIVIEEDSNNMNINAFFSASGDLNLDFVGTKMSFDLHNRRGTSTAIVATGDSFAHAQLDVGVAEDYTDKAGVAIGDALSVSVTDFSGDLDLTNIRMGNDTSLGDLYVTDMVVTADMVIYGH